MKGSVNKGFITYLLLFLGMIVGVVLVCLTIMMFSPGVDILGYIYCAENSRTTITNYNGIDATEFDGQTSVIKDRDGNVIQPIEAVTSLDYLTLEKVIIKTNQIDVNFIHGQENRIDIIRNISGFVKTEEYSNFVVTKQYDSVTDQLIITAYDTNLLLTLSSTSKIDVIISDMTPNVSYEVETTSGVVTFATKEFSNLVAKNLQAQDLKVTTETGNILIGELATIGTTLDLKNQKGNIELFGTLGALETNKLTNISLEVGEGNIKTQNLYANAIAFTGNNTFVTAKDIYGDVEMAIARGNFEALEIEGNLVDSGEIVKNTRMVINKISGEFTIPASEASYIKLGEVGGTVYIISTTGAVEIKNALGNVDIVTTSGAVTVLFNSTATANIQTERGIITCLFNVMNGEKNITSENGAIIVYHKDGLAFKLVADSNKTINLVSENLTFENPELPIEGYPTQGATPFATSDILTLTTGDANITITRIVDINWTIIEPAA